METDVEDFLAHYGKKGMKWGVRTASAEVKAARKAGRAENAKNLQARYTKTNADGKTVMKKRRTAATVVDLMATGGGYTGIQIAKSAGFTRGQSAAIGMLSGPVGAMVASEIKVRQDVSRANR